MVYQGGTGRRRGPGLVDIVEQMKQERCNKVKHGGAGAPRQDGGFAWCRYVESGEGGHRGAGWSRIRRDVTGWSMVEQEH